MRTCTNGVLSGSYPRSVCVIEPIIEPVIQTSVISGVLWNDADGDRVIDADEKGYAGRLITLLKNNAMFSTTKTDGDGKFQFVVPTASGYRLVHDSKRFTATGALCDGTPCSTDHSVPVHENRRKVDFGMRSVSPCSVTIRDFGAVGDGQSDDTDAVHRALASSCAVSGENLSYKFTSAVNIPTGTNLTDATFIQALLPASVIRAIQIKDVSNVKLTRIRLDRGSDPSFGVGPTTDAFVQQLHTAAVWLSGATNVTLTDVEVYGHGVGTGIKIENSSQIRLIRPYVHDMQWASVRQAENEVMVGIWSILSKDVRVESPRVANLSPTNIVYATDVGFRKAGSRTNMTDAITSSGTEDLVITNAVIMNTGEGFDFSGSHITKNFTISGANVYDVDSYCYKVTNVQGPGIIRDSLARRCGLGGYVLAGNVTNVQFINDKAFDIGFNGNWTAYTIGGFILQLAYNMMPSNITITDSEATDTQAMHTMKYGFVSDKLVSSNSLINSRAAGFLTSERHNFAAPAGSCAFEGTTILNGTSITAYEQGSVPQGNSCVSQIRTCTNGTLSGSYPRIACVVGYAANSCTFNGQTVPHGSSVIAYQQGSLPAGYSCAAYSETRTCNNGVLSGSYAQAICSVEPSPCQFNGTSVPHGGSVTAYQQGSLPQGYSCAAFSETRTCNNGTLSGTYQQASCSISKSDTDASSQIAGALSALKVLLEAIERSLSRFGL